MQVFVQTLTGKTVPIQVDSSSKVAQVKSHFQLLECLGPEPLTLYLDGKVAAEDNLISDLAAEGTEIVFNTTLSTQKRSIQESILHINTVTEFGATTLGRINVASGSRVSPFIVHHHGPLSKNPEDCSTNTRMEKVMDALAWLSCSKSQKQVVAIGIQFNHPDQRIRLVIAENTEVPKSTKQYVKRLWRSLATLSQLNKIIYATGGEPDSLYAEGAETPERPKPSVKQVVQESAAMQNLYDVIYGWTAKRFQEKNEEYLRPLASAMDRLRLLNDRTEEETLLAQIYYCLSELHKLIKPTVSNALEMFAKQLTTHRKVEKFFSEASISLVATQRLLDHQSITRAIQKLAGYHRYVITLVKATRSARLRNVFVNYELKVKRLPHFYPPLQKINQEQVTPMQHSNGKERCHGEQDSDESSEDDSDSNVLSPQDAPSQITGRLLLPQAQWLNVCHGFRLHSLPSDCDDAVKKLSRAGKRNVQHCEVKLATFFEAQRYETGPWSQVPAFRYFGVSKLSCVPCATFLVALGDHGGPAFFTKGSHLKWYPSWSCPTLSSQSPDRIGFYDELLRQIAVAYRRMANSQRQRSSTDSSIATSRSIRSGESSKAFDHASLKWATTIGQHTNSYGEPAQGSRGGRNRGRGRGGRGRGGRGRGGRDRGGRARGSPLGKNVS